MRTYLFAIAALPILLLFGYNASIHATSPASIEQATNTISGPNKVELGCGAVYTYSGDESSTGHFEISGDYTYFNPVGTWAEVYNGYNPGNATLTFVSSDNTTVLATKNITFASGGVCGT